MDPLLNVGNFTEACDLIQSQERVAVTALNRWTERQAELKYRILYLNTTWMDEDGEGAIIGWYCDLLNLANEPSLLMIPLKLKATPE